MKTLACFLVAVALFAARASAQTDPCATAVQPFTVTTGSPLQVTFLLDSSVPTSPTDPTLVPTRVDGVTVWVDNGTPAELGKLLPASPCPSGTFLGKLPFSFRSPFGVAKGAHTLNIKAWNYILDPVTGAPTTTRADGGVVSIPFAVADLVVSHPPPTPVNVIIKR